MSENQNISFTLTEVLRKGKEEGTSDDEEEDNSILGLSIAANNQFQRFLFEQILKTSPLILQMGIQTDKNIHDRRD